LCPLSLLFCSQPSHQEPALLQQERVPAGQKKFLAEAKTRHGPRLQDQPEGVPESMVQSQSRLLAKMEGTASGIWGSKPRFAESPQIQSSQTYCKDGRVRAEFQNKDRHLLPDPRHSWSSCKDGRVSTKSPFDFKRLKQNRRRCKRGLNGPLRALSLHCASKEAKGHDQ
jgi:hypothetical protein